MSDPSPTKPPPARTPRPQPGPEGPGDPATPVSSDAPTVDTEPTDAASDVRPTGPADARFVPSKKVDEVLEKNDPDHADDARDPRTTKP